MKLYKDPCYTVSPTTFVVAASNSLHKQRADYTCNGVNDQVDIQAAINALPDHGGRIILSDGIFSISDTIHLYRDIPEWFNLFIQGQGIQTTKIILADNSDCDIIDLNVLNNPSGFKGLSDLSLDGNKANQASGHGISAYKTGAGSLYDSRFRNVFAHHIKEKGFNLAAMWGCYVDNCLAEACDDDGLYLYASESYVYGFHSSGNGGAGIHIRGSELALSNLRIASNAKDALRLENTFSSTINGAYIKGWGTLADYAYWGVNSGQNNHHNDLSNINIIGNSNEATWAGLGIYGDYCTFGNITVKDVRNNPVSFHSLSSYNTLMNCILHVGTVTGDGISDSGIGNKWFETHSDLFMDVLAVSATHVRSNEDLSVATPITFTIDAQPDVPRTLSGHFDSHANITAYTIAIVGVDAKGNTLTETKTEADGWDWETSNAFATITSITMSARTGTGATDTMDIGITDVLGLSNFIYGTGDVFKIKKDNANAVVAAAQVNTTYDTYDMSVIGLAATNDFTIWLKSNLNIII